MSILLSDPKDYAISYQRVFHRRACAEITCVGHVSEGGQVSIEVFTSLLIALVEFEALVSLIYVTGEVFVKLDDYRVDLV